MFTQLAYSRRPLIATYRRKTRIERFIDSSDDDSDLDEQQRRSIAKEQHAASRPPQDPIVQQQHQEPLLPSLLVFSPPPCQPEKQQIKLALVDPPTSPPSSHLPTDTIAYVPGQQQPSDHVESMNTLDILPLSRELDIPSISTEPILLSLPLPQQSSDAVSELLFLQEQSAASSSFSSYGQTLFENTPQDIFDFATAGIQMPTGGDDVSSLAFPSQRALQPPLPFDVWGPPPLSVLSPPCPHPPPSANIHQQQALFAFDFLESSPLRRIRGVQPSQIATTGASVIPQQDDFGVFGYSTDYSAPPPQQQQQSIEQDFFNFPELPPQRPQLLLQSSVVPDASAQNQQHKTLEFTEMWQQWTSSPAPLPSAKELQQQQPIAKQSDIFDFPCLPPQALATSFLKQKHKTKSITTPLSTAKKDIFDFPDEDPNDEVIVSSPLLLQHHNKKKKKKVPMAPPRDVTESTSSNSGSNSTSSTSKQRQGKQVRFAPEMLVSTFRQQSFERDEPRTLPVKEKRVKETTVTDENRPPHPLPFVQTLKRKRNLISGLKSAVGVAATQGQLRRYDFDKEEEEIDTASATRGQLLGEESEDNDDVEVDDKHGQTTPSWLDLVGAESDEGSPVPHRPQYQPQNPMNVRVTYGRHRGSASQDPEMVELDNLLSQLRDCK